MLSLCLADIVYLLTPQIKFNQFCVQHSAPSSKCLFCPRLPALFVQTVIFPFILFHRSLQFSLTYLFLF